MKEELYSNNVNVLDAEKTTKEETVLSATVKIKSNHFGGSFRVSRVREGLVDEVKFVIHCQSNSGKEIDFLCTRREIDLISNAFTTAITSYL